MSSQPYLEIAPRKLAVDITRVVDSAQADWPATAKAAVLVRYFAGNKRSSTEGNRSKGWRRDVWGGASEEGKEK